MLQKAFILVLFLCTNLAFGQDVQKEYSNLISAADYRYKNKDWNTDMGTTGENPNPYFIINTHPRCMHTRITKRSGPDSNGSDSWGAIDAVTG